MPEYPPGTPSWVDLSSPDPDASAAFYKELFGWEAIEAGDPDETGGYRQFKLDDKSVTGLSPLWGEQQMPWWTTYISVASADRAAEKVRGAGGSLIMEPFDVLDAGRMALFMDATGAVCAVWEPKGHSGAELVNKPGSLCWNELNTRDTEKAKDFYRAVFGWETERLGPDDPYERFKLGDKVIAGLREIDDDVPAEVPANWGVCFAVEDTDAAAAKVEPAGGQVFVPPTDIPVGRFAVVTDPQGAQFAVITLAEWSREVGEAQAAEIGAA